MQRKDWTLLAICAAGSKGLTPVQLQKTLFVLGQEQSHAVGADYYHFSAYDYGPFDRAVYDDAEDLAQAGFVVIAIPPEQSWRQFIATAPGCERAQGLRRAADAEVTDFLDRLVSWVSRQPFQKLVRAIYDRYPTMRANSVFVE